MVKILFPLSILIGPCFPVISSLFRESDFPPINVFPSGSRRKLFSKMLWYFPLDLNFGFTVEFDGTLKISDNSNTLTCFEDKNLRVNQEAGATPTLYILTYYQLFPNTRPYNSAANNLDDWILIRISLNPSNLTVFQASNQYLLEFRDEMMSSILKMSIF